MIFLCIETGQVCVQRIPAHFVLYLLNAIVGIKFLRFQCFLSYKIFQTFVAFLVGHLKKNYVPFQRLPVTPQEQAHAAWH